MDTYGNIGHMRTHTNPFTQPKAGGTQATTHDRLVELVTTINEASAELMKLTRQRGVDNDTLLEVAKASKEASTTVLDAYKRVKEKLFTEYGSGKHATDGGQEFSFTPSVGRRAINYDKLKSQFPAVYENMVTVSEPKPGAVGTFRIFGK